MQRVEKHVIKDQILRYESTFWDKSKNDFSESCPGCASFLQFQGNLRAKADCDWPKGHVCRPPPPAELLAVRSSSVWSPTGVISWLQLSYLVEESSDERLWLLLGPWSNILSRIHILKVSHQFSTSVWSSAVFLAVEGPSWPHSVEPFSSESRWELPIPSELPLSEF